MRAGGKAWSLFVFSSANTVRLYSLDDLVALGVSWVWLGLEGKDSGYAKLRRTDTRELVRDLQSRGIRVLGSTIIGLPEHSPETIDAAIDYALEHGTEFHQFMLYTPLPGTPLHAAHAAEGTLLGPDECPEADVHGQSRFNFRHPRIPAGDETRLLLRAFERDFAEHGPSVLRIAKTALQGFRAHRSHADPRVRERFAREARGLATTYAGAVWAAERRLADRPPLARKLKHLREELVREFGLLARVSAPVVGAAVRLAMWVEERRLRRGQTWEPPTFYEGNAAALAEGVPADRCRWVAPAVRVHTALAS
jgi:hypothetical protein